jgi:amino acid transporter
MTAWSRLRRAVLGAPKDVKDPHAFHKLSLIALLAWVGLGADGLSSSAYGPPEAYKALGEHQGLAVFLALATALTVFIISYGYSRIIEAFPSGGGGYVVASKLLGQRIGVLSGAALLVDYVLTITISIASGADAIFSFLPPSWHPHKLAFAFFGLVLLTVMNLRGVKESVTTIAPIFGVFVVTHAILLLVAIGGHAANIPEVAREVHANVGTSVAALGTFGAVKLFVRAYSLGGGTYTGIEAVSNGVSMMREPRVATAKRTMVLMATSLAITAGGILLSYLLVHAQPMIRVVDGKEVEIRTLNAVLLDAVAGGFTLGGIGFGKAFVVVALASEGLLLFVAAQAGFLDGPRVMANMATDSWLPHRFSALSERLTMRNGVLLMAAAAAAALAYTAGAVDRLVVMYSINVFLTFSLSNIAMTRYWVRHRKEDPSWWRHLPAHVLASILCLTILVITILEKFAEGGWLTVLITLALTGLCFLVKRHYGLVVRALRRLDKELPGPEAGPDAALLYGDGAQAVEGAPDPRKPVAVLFVGGYGGLGRHALFTMLRMFPNHFKGICFASVAVVDSDTFKGASEVESLEERTKRGLASYERFARALGLPASSAFRVGTEVAVEAEKLAIELSKQYPKALVVAGQIIFEEDTAWNRILHNETAFLIQRRLQHAGVPMIVLPVQLDLLSGKKDRPTTTRAGAYRSGGIGARSSAPPG